MTRAVANPATRWTDQEVDQVIGRLLQIGVLSATIVVLIGSVMLLTRHGTAVADYHVFKGAPENLRSLRAIADAVRSGDPAAIVQLGLVLLIATPIARVLLTLVAFIIQRDRLYVMLTTVVLAVLLYGLL